MKKTIKIMGVAVLSLLTVSLSAQQTEPQQQTKTDTGWNAKKNPAVQEINSKYDGKLIAPKQALTNNDIFPVIGTYKSTTNPEAETLSITLDEQNKGLVWVDGLPQGRVKAMLRKSPAVYKIPAQKTADGKEVAEGTLIFDKETNTLSICIGKNYNHENPSLVFAEPQVTEEVVVNTKKVKTKQAPQPKAWTYVGTKVEKATAMN